MHWKIEMTHQPRRLTAYTLPINEELEGSLLAGCEKTIWACHRFTGPPVWGNRRTPNKMLKKAIWQAVRRESST